MSIDDTQELDENTVYQRCFLTDQRFEESEMVRVPMNAGDLYLVNRRDHALSRGESIDGRFDNINYVWITADMDTGYCNDCGALYDKDDYDVISSLEVCVSCGENYMFCDRHEQYYADGDYCYYCDENDSSENGLVHDYSYRPPALFHIINRHNNPVTVGAEPRATAVTGFELEMEAVDCDSYDGASLAHDMYEGVAYLKHDGSISDGFEMVTHPMTLDYINSTFNFNGMKRLADLGMRSASTSTCGLHVHINKGYFDNRATSLYRFMSLFYRNEEQWKRIAGRSRSTYAQWDSSEHDRMIQYVKNLKNAYGRGSYNYDRYVAVNLQPAHTIELRFFKGTLRAESLKARLQAVHAAAEYSVFTRNIVSIRKSSDWEAFREWTSKDPDRFGSFNTYATEKGI